VPVLKCLAELDPTISILRESESESDPPVWIGKQPGGGEPIEPPVVPPVDADGKHEIKITIEDGKVTVVIDGVERS
jgi:hypothetical protein